MFEHLFPQVIETGSDKAPCTLNDSLVLPGYLLRPINLEITVMDGKTRYWCTALKRDHGQQAGTGTYKWVEIPFETWKALLTSIGSAGEPMDRAASALSDIAYGLRPLETLAEALGALSNAADHVAEGIASWFGDALDLVCERFDGGRLQFLKRSKSR